MITISGVAAWLKKNHVKGADGYPYPTVGKPLTLNLTHLVVGAWATTYKVRFEVRTGEGIAGGRRKASHLANVHPGIVSDGGEIASYFRVRRTQLRQSGSGKSSQRPKFTRTCKIEHSW